MGGFLRILAYLKRYKTLTFLNVIFNVLTVIFGLFSVAMLIPFLSLLFETDTTEMAVAPPIPEFQLSIDYLVGLGKHHFVQYIIQHGKFATLGLVCGVIIVVFLLKNLFRYLAQFVMAPIRNGVVLDIRNRVYQKVTSLPLSFFSKERRGDLMARMTQDVQEVEYGIIATLETMIVEPVTIILSLGFMFYLSPQLTLFVLIMILITALIIGRIGKSLKRASKKGQAKMGELVSLIDETLLGLKIMKAFTAERRLEARFDKENRAYMDIMNRMLRRKFASSPLTEFLAIVILVIVLWYGGKMVLAPDGVTNKILPEVFIGFMVIFSQLIPPAKNFSSAYYNIQKGLASHERIETILDATSEVTDSPDAKPIDRFEHQIEYKNVSFAYYNFDNHPVLQNINVVIKKGKMLALVGSSGSGKTTFADMLPRFYDVLKGGILIDGIDTREYKLRELRKLMGIVTQEPVLFNDSVHNNITFGMDGDVPREEVIRAAKIANAHEFIDRLEHGYDTNIGDRGTKLSGGERQRLTIARAVLSDPPILILDEATSSLDTKSEKLVQEAIYKLMENRTTIVIAHRLSTIQYADEILVMQSGEIIERGNHISLMAKGGAYKKLVDLQAF
jgi:ATP-binding cassette, subfamily B, bacterial MsbA